MPIRYERDDVRRGAIVTMEGPFDAVELLTVIDRQRDDDAWSYGMLYDLRGMTGDPLIADLRPFMSQAALIRPPRDPGYRPGHL